MDGPGRIAAGNQEVTSWPVILDNKNAHPSNCGADPDVYSRSEANKRVQFRPLVLFRTLPAKYVEKIADQMRTHNINALLIVGGFEVRGYKRSRAGEELTLMHQ